MTLMKNGNSKKVFLENSESQWDLAKNIRVKVKFLLKLYSTYFYHRNYLNKIKRKQILKHLKESKEFLTLLKSVWALANLGSNGPIIRNTILNIATDVTGLRCLMMSCVPSSHSCERLLKKEWSNATILPGNGIHETRLKFKSKHISCLEYLLELRALHVTVKLCWKLNRSNWVDFMISQTVV